MHQAWRPVELVPPARRSRTAVFALVLASLISLTLAAARIFNSVSLTTPLQLTTSGAEEEALASIWRFIHGETVFTDPRAIPYTASYFNWLFYVGYGNIAGDALRAFGLHGSWLPTICRLITLTLAVLGAAIFAGLLRRLTDERIGRTVAVLLAGLAFFNPLCGFWVITTRPDLGAAVLELGAVAVFLRHRRTGNRRDLIVVALLFGAAWAFKQTSLGALTGIALALLFRHESLRGRRDEIGRRLFWLIGPVLAGATIACAILGTTFRRGLYLSQIHSGFHLSWALLHFGAALLKMPFIAVALVGAAWTWRRSDGDLRMIAWVLASTFFLELVASSKGGAGDYYFLSLGVWSVLWIAVALQRCPFPALVRAVLAAAVLQTGAVATVFVAHRGVIDPRNPGQPYEHLTRYLADRPGPVFVQDTYGDLPWISPRAPHFVIAYNNELDARAGVRMEDGGWPGLLQRGYFATVVMKADESPLDRGLLAKYRFVRAETGWRYYERR